MGCELSRALVNRPLKTVFGCSGGDKFGRETSKMCITQIDRFYLEI